ncbi:MAG: beta-Ala-His dipeptidase [Oscillospiraceae bacterium]|nr:beta-Ala-His dipeptidase [Oscillospiraceae bacterium]
MEFDVTKPHCHYFYELTRIPHGSYNEKELSDWLVAFANERGLRSVQDEMGNVVIYKPASAGCENSAPLLLQAHMDMVCEANKGTDHDFEKDPLDLEVVDGWLTAKGTTLGADDGTGVAYMLSILDDPDLPHPPLECCFTVQEEIGLCGALNLKPEYFQSKRMVCLDGGGEVSTCTTSAGGTRVDSTFVGTVVSNSDPCYQISVGGLAGGHSGGEIHMEKGNSIVTAVRFLKEMMVAGVDVELVSINGGLKDNAIPRECDVVFASATDPELIRKAFCGTEASVREELEFSDSGFKASCEAVDVAEKKFDADSTARLVNYLYLAPNGFQHRSMAIPGLTVVSLNLGIIRTEGDTVKSTHSLRSALKSGIPDLVNKIRTLADLFGAEITLKAAYPGWNYSPVSDMRDKLAAVLKRVDNAELKCEATHGGNECGVFNSLGVEDIITYGPIAQFIHTPDERLDLASFDRSFAVLTELVKECI